MPIDFEQEYGVNAGYVQALFETWTDDPGQVEETWAEIFQQLVPAGAKRAEPESPTAPAAQVEAEPELEEQADEVEPLRGLPAKIAENMSTSLELPTATTFRTLPVKILEENRKVLNEHLSEGV